MSGAQRGHGRGRPRRNVEEPEEYYDQPNANMWAEMMHQHQQFQAQEAQHHHEMMMMLQVTTTLNLRIWEVVLHSGSSAE
jgi:hypothetical protein